MPGKHVLDYVLIDESIKNNFMSELRLKAMFGKDPKNHLIMEE